MASFSNTGLRVSLFSRVLFPIFCSRSGWAEKEGRARPPTYHPEPQQVLAWPEFTRKMILVEPQQKSPVFSNAKQELP
ncbi:hypothetical protein CLAIMM_02749 [Cladophialophora immunda]|nr:hypothetical protein CLAIMM_02749 [Cladophialophora immunda]